MVDVIESDKITSFPQHIINYVSKTFVDTLTWQLHANEIERNTEQLCSLRKKEKSMAHLIEILFMGLSHNPMLHKAGVFLMLNHLYPSLIFEDKAKSIHIE
jgi:hypothetical protein